MNLLAFFENLYKIQAIIIIILLLTIFAKIIFMANSKTDNLKDANEDLAFTMAGKLNKKKVLIADPHSTSRNSMQMVLSKIDITNVTGVSSTKEVIKAVKKETYDIIISEYYLGDDRNGQQLLEELRYAKIIPLTTAYVIVTSESKPTNVVSLAELVPDAFILKPVTIDALQNKLLKAIYKKHVLQKVYERIAENNLQEVILACNRVIQQYPEFEQIAIRHKAEAYLRLDYFKEASLIYAQVMKEHQAPWAKMGLAFSLKGQGHIDEAQKLAEELVEEHVHFIALYDFLANIYTEKDQLDKAQEILEKCHKIAPHNLERQRLFGNIALKNGDIELAQKIFGMVIKQGKDSSLRTAEDFGNLAEVNLKKGDAESSAELLSTIKKEQKNVIKNKIDELEFLITEAFCLISGNLNAQLQAKELIEKALTNLKSIQNSEEEKQNLNARIYTHLAVVCNKAGMEREAGRLIIQAGKLKQENSGESN